MIVVYGSGPHFPEPTPTDHNHFTPTNHTRRNSMKMTPDPATTVLPAHQDQDRDRKPEALHLRLDRMSVDVQWTNGSTATSPDDVLISASYTEGNAAYLQTTIGFNRGAAEKLHLWLGKYLLANPTASTLNMEG